ncbi:MAG: MFS transporter [Chloroflexi bacterium]|nr:MFS transporter [Chloroflexota bacterium]
MARLQRLFRSTLVTPYPVDGTNDEQRRGLQMLWWDTLLSAMSAAFVVDFETLYLLELGASSTTIGARASIVASAALLAPLVGAWLVARSGRRKIWVLLSGGGLGRVALFLSALAPTLFMNPAASVTYVLILTAVRSFMGSVTLPPFNSLFGDLVPAPIRGRVMGIRMMASSAVTVLMLPLAGYLIKAIGGSQGYQATLLVASVLGFAATCFYARIPEIQGEESQRQRPGVFAEGFKSFTHDRGFVLFCIINFIWTLGIQVSGPFFSVHQVETLGFGVDTIALLATIVTVFNVFAVRAAGPLVDRYGAERVTAIAMLLVPLMPVAWIFARTPLTVGLARVYGVLAWAGVHVAAMPLILQISPARYRSQYIAIFNTLNGVAAVLGPLPAAWLYATYGFRTNLLLSAIGRGMGALLFLVAYKRGIFRSSQEGEGPLAEPGTVK